MNVEIREIKGHGDADEERLVLTVLREDDVGYYVVFDTTIAANGGVSNQPRHTYWFPDKRVDAGDLVVLYTKPGTPKEKPTQTGSTTHFFYWGLKETIWERPGGCAVLMRARTWEAREAVAV